MEIFFILVPLIAGVAAIGSVMIADRFGARERKTQLEAGQTMPVQPVRLVEDEIASHRSALGARRGPARKIAQPKTRAVRPSAQGKTTQQGARPATWSDPKPVPSQRSDA